MSGKHILSNMSRRGLHVKILSIEQLSQEFNIDKKTIHRELLNVIKQLETKKVKKHFIFDETSKNVFVIKHQDVQFIHDGRDKISFISVADHFKINADTMNWLLNRLQEKGVIDEQVLRYYTEVRNKPFIKAWFEPAEIMVEQEVILDIELSCPSQIDQPKLTVTESKGLELKYKPKPPTKIRKGKRLEKYKYKGTKHGEYKISVELEGTIEGVKYGPKKAAEVSLRIRPQPPKLHVRIYPKKVSATYGQESTLKFSIENKGPGEATNIEIGGLNNHPEFDFPSSTKLGNLSSHGKTDHPLRMKTTKSGKYIFDDIVLTYEDAEGKKFKETIPSINIDVRTPKPELKIEFISPPTVRSDQIFVLTIRITNIGKGAARNIFFELPVDPKILVSGYMSYSVDRLGPNETEEFTLSLQAPKDDELRINDFDVTLENIEGTSLTENGSGILIPIRKAKVRPAPTTEWPFTRDNLIGGKYHIREEIGEGGFAKVYLAEDTYVKDRVVALKALKADFVSEPSVVELFLQEARITLDFQDPNIVRVFEVDKETWTDQAYPYIIMEYMDGGTLQDRLIPSKPMSMIDSMKIMPDICAALICTHQQKVFHCDVKPSNIFYDEKKDLWKLGDFGLAKIVQKSEVSPTSLGTLSYIAPEVFEGKIVGKSDVYSLGLVFREMLTGNPKGDLSKLESRYKRTDRAKLGKMIDLVERMTNRSLKKRPNLAEVYKTVRWSATWVAR